MPLLYSMQSIVRSSNCSASLTNPSTACRTSCFRTYSIVRMSEKPVTSKISFTSSDAFFTTMLPCLFITFWAESRTLRPAEEIYSNSVNVHTDFILTGSYPSHKRVSRMSNLLTPPFRTPQAPITPLSRLSCFLLYRIGISRPKQILA